MITQTSIIQALDQRFKHYFDQSSADDGTLADRFKEIAADIFGTPQIRPAKWLIFEKTGSSPSGKTHIYQVRQKQAPHALIGEVKWHPVFRSYSLFTMPDIIYEPQCLSDIMLFIEALMHLHPKNKKQPAFVGTAAFPLQQGSIATGHTALGIPPSIATGYSSGISSSSPAAKKINLDNSEKNAD